MKGVVFTEFLEMVESAFGPDLADRMIVQSDLPTGGVYTAVGTYPHGELVSMVVQLSALTNTPADALVRAYGEHLFGRFAVLFPRFFVGVTSALDFLQGVESYIHPEVRKLYPDADLPRFEPTRHDADHLDLVYRSSRHFADLANGLIRGCGKHFGELLAIRREPVAEPDGSTAVRFVVARAAEAIAPARAA